MKPSRAFAELKQEQTSINRFFWSSEISLAVSRKIFSTGEYIHSSQFMQAHLPDLKCNAFIPPENGEKTKYEKTASIFVSNLDHDFESLCKFVIVQMYRAYERFLSQRCLFSHLSSKEQLGLFSYLRRGASRDIAIHLKSKKLVVRDFDAESYKRLRENFLDVQIYHLVRHDIAHGDDNEAINIGASSWSDLKVYKRSKDNKNGLGGDVFPRNTTQEEMDEAINRVCQGARRKRRKNPETPLIFFYALFCLGAYNRLAKQLDHLLPPLK